MNSRVLYSGFRFGHHNRGSGYDALVDRCEDYVCGNTLPLGRYPEASLPRRVNFLLVDLLTLMRGVRYDAIHYLYPENTAYVSPIVLKWLGKRIVFTVHLTEATWLGPTRSPYMRLKQLSLGKADVIVTLSAQQALAYAAHFAPKLVRFVPHGLSFDQACPPDVRLRARLSTKQVVVVGHNYRDMDLLERIIDGRGARDVRFHLVGMHEAAKLRFSRRINLVCHARLSPEQYAALLQTCTAMLLPLSFATANNAMLEAYANFLPVLSTRIAGVTDYAVDHNLLFGDELEFWSRFDTLCARDVASYRALCIALHAEAKARFSWEEVRKMLTALYD